MDLIRQLGPLAYASRLKRLSERLMHDVSKIYRMHDADFEARWFPVAYLLLHKSPMGITEIAEALGYSHPAVSQIAGEMEKHALVRSPRTSGDGRRRLLVLTPRGRTTLKRVKPVWEAIRRCTEDVIHESGYDGLAALDAVENALSSMDMYTRIRKTLRPAAQEVRIIPYRSAFRRAFRTLNLEWLGREIPLEPHDRRVLYHPDVEIISKGGQVFFARVNRAMVGTVAVIPRESDAFEVTKMAVTEQWRGAGIGRRLANTAIVWAHANGAGEIRIATSPKLTAALALYRSMGFVETKPDAAWRAEYRRRTIFFKMLPNSSNTENEEIRKS